MRDDNFRTVKSQFNSPQEMLSLGLSERSPERKSLLSLLTLMILSTERICSSIIPFAAMTVERPDDDDDDVKSVWL